MEILVAFKFVGDSRRIIIEGIDSSIIFLGLRDLFGLAKASDISSMKYGIKAGPTIAALTAICTIAIDFTLSEIIRHNTHSAVAVKRPPNIFVDVSFLPRKNISIPIIRVMQSIVILR
jgi:hypothetical protein